MARWGMVIDLRKCIGCETCVNVCYAANNVPPEAGWRRLIDWNVGSNTNSRRLFVPTSCMHCDNPPCKDVCPTSATYVRPDGIVDINHDLCIGCGACVVACPYNARSFSNSDLISFEEGIGQVDENVEKPDLIGVCTKCNFCRARLDEGLKKGLQPGLDPEATPICVNYCIADAMCFGNLDDPESEVSKLISENKTSRLQEDLETSPCVYYIIN